jgi:hypothetical protein
MQGYARRSKKVTSGGRSREGFQRSRLCLRLPFHTLSSVHMSCYEASPEKGVSPVESHLARLFLSLKDKCSARNISQVYQGHFLSKRSCPECPRVCGY